MSEAGIVDAFFFIGPKPKDMVRQYTSVTGTPAMPQFFFLFLFFFFSRFFFFFLIPNFKKKKRKKKGYLTTALTEL